MSEALGSIPTPHRPEMAVHACHPNTEEVEAGEQKFKIILSDSYSEFEVSLGYNKTLFQKKQKIQAGET